MASTVGTWLAAHTAWPRRTHCDSEEAAVGGRPYHGAHGVATPTHCDNDRRRLASAARRRTRRGHADSLRHGILAVGGLGVSGRTRRGHANSLRRVDQDTARPRRRAAHTAWPRRLIATGTPCHPPFPRSGRTRRGHADSLRHNGALNTSRTASGRTRRGHANSLRLVVPGSITITLDRRTRRGHADSLRLRSGELVDHMLGGAHGVATPTHCDGIYPPSLRPTRRAHTAWPRQLIATLLPPQLKYVIPGRTRRGHANSLRPPQGGHFAAPVPGAHGVATPTHCDECGSDNPFRSKKAHTAWPRQLIAT